MPRIKADVDVCMGYAMCVMNCPDVFDTNQDGTVVIRRGFGDEEADEVELAVNSCPTGALSIEWDRVPDHETHHRA